MQGTIVVIPIEGDITTTALTAVPDLEDMQAHVGGWLELLPRWSTYAGKPAVAFCNEEGLLKNLPVNVRATEMWCAQFSSGSVLRGNVIVLSGDAKFMEAL